jgi:hypothetical protein
MNLFDDIPARADDEISANYFHETAFVSSDRLNGSTSGHDDWVVLLAGSAGLRIEANVSAIFVLATMR